MNLVMSDVKNVPEIFINVIPVQKIQREKIHHSVIVQMNIMMLVELILMSIQIRTLFNNGVQFKFWTQKDALKLSVKNVPNNVKLVLTKILVLNVLITE